MKNKKIYIFVCIIFFLSIIILTNFTSFYNIKNNLNGDDSPNYRLVKNYGIKGELYLKGDFLEYDLGNNLHQRGFLTWEGKTVPFNFLGLPLFYGTLYSILKDNLKIINPILLFIFLIYAYKISFNFIKREGIFIYVLIAFLVSLPIIYFFNFVYLNIVPSSLFFLMSFYYLFKFNKNKSFVYLFFSFLFCLVSIWFRYDYLVFFVTLYLINFILNKKDYLKQKKIFLKFAILISILILLLILPLGILNYQLYGSPVKFGYAMFNEIFFKAERSGNVLVSFSNMIFPAQEINLHLLFQNISNVFIMLSPIYFVFVILFLFKKSNELLKSWPYLILIIYTCLYMGMANVWGSDSPLISLDKAIFRYWFLLEVLFLIIFLLSLIELKNKKIKILLISVLLISSLIYLITSNTGIIQELNRIDKFNNLTEELDKITDSSDYLIGARYDKYYYGIINPVTWWAGTRKTESDNFFSVEDISSISKIIIFNNRTLYYLKDDINKNYIPLLEDRGLLFSEVPNFNGLYKISLNQISKFNSTTS